MNRDEFERDCRLAEKQMLGLPRRPKEDEQQKLRSNHTLQKKDPKMG